ncbi:MAG: hypothetical protein V3S97_09325, partial [Candidatus Bathyarchaeia archaeon]
MKSFFLSLWYFCTWFLTSHGSPKTVLPQNGQISYVIRRFIVTIKSLVYDFSPTGLANRFLF